MTKQDKTIEKQKRRSYDADFKASTLRLVAEGRTIADVARSLGLNERLVYKWKSQSQSSDSAVEVDAEKENMRRYIRKLETERAILEKALAVFSGKK
jgi:transposase